VDGETVSKLLNAGLGVFVIVAGSLRWFVFGWAYTEQKARADKYEALCLEMLRETRSSATRVERQL
jgi:hypothetical protein